MSKVQSNIKSCIPQRSPEFIALEMGFSNISNFNLTENIVENKIENKNETEKPTITLSDVTNHISNEFCNYLNEESRDYNLPLPVGIKETSQTTKLTNLVKRSISSTFLNIAETISAINSPNENSQKSPKASK